jgi:PRTRC genetic system protein E
VFTELKKLIAKRSLTITVAVLDNEQIRVNVVPHARPEDKKANESIKYSSKNEVPSVPEEAIKALTTPISITGTAEEIDAKFPAILSQYVESHVQLQETLSGGVPHLRNGGVPAMVVEAGRSLPTCERETAFTEKTAHSSGQSDSPDFNK